MSAPVLHAPAAPPVLVVQHEDQCPPAWFGRWLGEAGCRLDVRRPYAGDVLPADLTAHGGMLVLGGHMGAYDDRDAPWLPGVKELVREAAETEVPMFGICLGHQLAAVALGGRVQPSPRGQQLGVLPLGWSGEDDPVLAPRPQQAIQWNNDVVVELPGDAVVLASTPLDELQAVRFAPTVWGVQAHPEADLDVVRPWAEADRNRHGDHVVDTAVDRVRAEQPGLLAAWRPVAHAFADRVHAARRLKHRRNTGAT